jgi:CheY-like chemotaxis protein
MPRGGKLTIETSRYRTDGPVLSTSTLELQPGHYVLLSIRDTGCGMPPDVRQRIFEPFYTTKGPGKGTGLGLATVYGVVQQFAGQIEVYSEVDVGTVFKVYLPVAERTEKRNASETRTKAITGNETLLLVEDDDAVCMVARLALETQGYHVLSARSGQEALEIYAMAERPIDMLVTDVVMPAMSGRELAEILQRKRPDLKVLFLSGYTDDAIVRHGVLRADVAFLPKPYTPQALAIKVRAVLDEPAPSANASTGSAEVGRPLAAH